jgi:hypothetical protein
MTDESLFREVDEEVRQDEYKKLWNRHGRLLSLLAVAVIVAVGAYEGYKYYQIRQSEEAALVYFDALTKSADGKLDDALSAFKAVNHAGYGQLAALNAAGILAAKGDIEKAVATYDAFAADAANDPLLADVARIRAGYLLVDTTKPDQLLARLGKFDKDGEIWRHQAREIFGLAAWKTGDFVMADRYMTALLEDAETPPAMRQRAQVMVQLIAQRLPQKQGT